MIKILQKIKNHEALFIFSLTALGYLCTYIFQWGKFHYYSIPRSFIEINSNTIVSSLVFIFILLILFMFYIGFLKKIMDYLSMKESLITNIKKHNFLIQFFLVLGQIILIILSKNSNYNPIFFSMMLVLFMIYFTLKNYEYLLMIAYIAFILLGVFIIGYLISENESSYLIIKKQSTYQSYVVLDIQGGKALVAKVDLENNMIFPEYQLIKLETNKLNEHKLSLKEIKNLDVKK